MEAEDRRQTGMGSKPQYGGWAIVAIVIALIIVIAGAIVTLCRRHYDWQWGRRNIWSICQEWRQRLSWLWAPREEKVGLVKAQHPTAQTVPGLYRQPGNASQNLLHSDSDLRLDAQGAFTRFEAVDRDLHPPLGNTANAIPPQPLRPAPQPRATGRPRPSPLQAPSAASEYLRMMHEGGPGPLTPPPVPPVPRLPGPTVHRAAAIGGTVFVFQQPNDEFSSIPATTNSTNVNKSYGNGNPYKLTNIADQSNLRFETRTTRAIPESIQSSCYAMTKSSVEPTVKRRQSSMNFESRYETRSHDDDADEADVDDDDDEEEEEEEDDDEDNENNERKATRQENPKTRDVYTNARTSRSEVAGSYRQYELTSKDETMAMRYAMSSNGQMFIQDQSSLATAAGVNNNTDREMTTTTTETTIDSTGNNVNDMNTFSRKNERDSYDLHNCGNNSSAHRTIMESIYGPQAMVAKLHLQNSENWQIDSRTRNSHESPQSIEMTAYLQKSASFNRDEQQLQQQQQESFGNSMKAQQRVSQYIESLPDLPGVYENPNTETSPAGTPITRREEQEAIFRRLEDHQHHHQHHYHEDMTSDDRRRSQLTSESPPPPPPPAPPDLSRDLVRQNSAPTTGERIFSALRSVTSQSYIDASEFYNSVLSSAQQQVPRFAFPTITRSSMSLIESDTTRQRENPRDEVASFRLDPTRRGSDLYSPELNLEAHRTAQEVYNSLQDPPASPLLLRDLSQEPYPYMSDPSFTRTSEDIFNSIEQRRKSMERLNGIHETHYEIEAPDGTPRRRNSQDLYAALEEVQLKRRLSQNIDDPYSGAGWLGGMDQQHIGSDGSSLANVNRRGSQQAPEPEPPPDESNLKRAISCESVCSDTSVNLGDLEANATVVGHVCVGLEHERWGGRGADCEGDLAVSVLEARDLVAPDGRPGQDTLARVCLLPDRETHVQTRLYRGSPHPSYQEKFLFPLDGGPIGRTLLVQIFSVEVSIGCGASLLGEASLKLGPAARPPATTWLPLIGPGALPFPHHGELMFSLSYLPTAERLTLVVVKARNLRGANPPIPGDFFVKVYLLQQGKKMHKKRTMTKRGEKSPIFNEAIIFSVPPHALQTIQLRLTVAETDPATQSTSKAFSVGHIIVGSTAAGKSLAHWRHMLAALRRPVAMWHPLRK